MSSSASNPNSVKAGDTEPLVATLSDANGPMNIAGAAVLFRMASLVDGVGHARIEAACEILQFVDGQGRIQNKGMVQYVWAAGQTDVPGQYGLEWKVTFGDGTVRTFPNDRTVSFTIRPSV
jgi:hypothetical protein